MNIENINNKRKIDKLDFIKIKNFCSSKNTNKKVNTQATDWEKIFIIHIFNKGLISRIIKSSYNSIIKNINNPSQKWTKEQYLTKDI